MEPRGLKQRVVAVRDRLWRLVGRPWFVGSLVLSVVYLGVWLVLQRSVQFHRQVDFFGQSGRSWIQLGSMRFSPEAWDSFVGIVFHPLVFAILSVPALLAGVLLLAVLAALLFGYVSSIQEDRAMAHRRTEDQRVRLAEMAIRAGQAQTECQVCGRKRDGTSMKCRGCGAAWASI